MALLLGLLAVYLRDRNPTRPDAHRPIGVVALINGASLLVLTLLVDTLADAGAAAGVAVAGAVIAATGRYHWLDPAIALLVCVLVTVAATHVIAKAVASLRGVEVDFDDD